MAVFVQCQLIAWKTRLSKHKDFRSADGVVKDACQSGHRSEEGWMPQHQLNHSGTVPVIVATSIKQLATTSAIVST